jgi:hypothetical protein
MSLVNFYDYTKKDTSFKNPNYKTHGIEIPFRMIICAPSGSGKTNFLCNLICAFDSTFFRIIICVKNKAEPLYEMIEDKLNKSKMKQVDIYEDGEVPKLPDDKKNRLIIFDDLLYDNQSEIKQYFIRGRKKGFSCIYLTQSYFKTPKDLRLQCNYIVLGRNVLKRDLNIILQEIASNLSLDELQLYYNQATKEPLHVLMIDLVKRQLRHNINNFLTDL